MALSEEELYLFLRKFVVRLIGCVVGVVRGRGDLGGGEERALCVHRSAGDHSGANGVVEKSNLAGRRTVSANYTAIPPHG